MTQCSLQPKEASKFYARHKTRYRAPCGKDTILLSAIILLKHTRSGICVCIANDSGIYDRYPNDWLSSSLSPTEISDR